MVRLVVVSMFLLQSVASMAAEPVSYRRDVLPILKRHCWGCHNASEPQGELSIDTVAEFAKGGKRGPSWKKGEAAEKSLVIRMMTGETKPSMPHKESLLSTAKVDIVRRWIQAGAIDDSPKTAAKPIIPDRYVIPPEITAVAFSLDGQRIAAACRSEVVVMPVDGDVSPQRLPTSCDLISFVRYSPDGKLLAVAGGVPGRCGILHIYRVEGGRIEPAWSKQTGADTFFRGAFSPDGQSLVLGGADGVVSLFAVNGKAEPRKFDLHSDWVTDVCFSTDGKYLISGGRDKAVKFTSLDKGEVIRAFAVGEGVTGVAAAPNLIVAVGRDRAPTVFDIKVSLADVQLSGTGNGAAPIVQTGKSRRLESLTGDALALAIHAGKKLIAVAGDFTDVRLIDFIAGKRVGLISTVTAPVFALAFNADASQLAVGGYDGKLRVFDTKSLKSIREVVPVPIVPVTGK